MTDKKYCGQSLYRAFERGCPQKIIEKEEPDSLLPTLGGQAALNIAMELYESGFPGCKKRFR